LITKSLYKTQKEMIATLMKEIQFRH